MRRRHAIELLGGMIAVGPLSAGAQQSARAPKIGQLMTGTLDSPDAQAHLTDTFREGLKALGYVEGRNIVIEHRSAEGRIERLPELARGLVELKVDVIFAGATPAGRAAQQATGTIPIIVSAMGDPVGDGLVASLSRPGGNITGTTFLGPELVPKRMALLRELLPNVSRVGVLWHPNAFSERTMGEMLKEAHDAAKQLGVTLQFVEARNADELEPAFAGIAAARCEVLFQFPSTMLYNERRRIVDMAAARRLPAMYNARQFVELGGLIAYGANLDELTRRAAVYVDKILKGAKPADLPVEQPTNFELVINLKTAQALGIAIPTTILARADEVIE